MPHTGWKITSQLTDQVENNNAGQTVVGVRIYFITGSGNEGSVFVANQHYTRKRVHEVVKEQAVLIDEIGDLAEGVLGQ